MPRPIHFEIPADDPARAVTFYRAVFDWKIDRWEGPQEYWLVTTGEGDEPGINGGLAKRRHPGEGPANTIGVPSLDAFVERVQESGGTIVAPKMAIPGIGWLAYCQDTEGNTFGMMEADPAAT